MKLIEYKKMRMENGVSLSQKAFMAVLRQQLSPNVQGSAHFFCFYFTDINVCADSASERYFRDNLGNSFEVRPALN